MLNYLGAYFKGDCLRKIALVGLNEITKISEIEALIKSNANAILFIIPNGPYKLIFEKLVNEIQIFLSQQKIFLPVYFTYETDELKKVYLELKNEYEYNLKSGNISKKEETKKSILDYLNIKESYLHFSLSIKEPKLKKSLNLENIYGFLEVPSQNGSPNPIIAIVAHYDTLGIISDLPQGINSNGSGIIALLELIRIISKFYENYETVIKYDILFVLTSGGNENFKGTETFINNLEPSINENLQYVLCLDSIGSLGEKDNLYLHLSRYPREYEVTPNKLYNIFNITAKNMGINLNYIKKKVFLSEDFVPWEHEQFSKKKIISATLSTLDSPPENIFTRNLFTDIDMDLNVVSKNIKFIVESLLKFLFDYDNSKFTIFKDDETLIDTKNLDTMYNYLKKTPRFPLSIERGSKFNNDMYNYFNLYLQRVKREPFELNEIQFYENNSGDIKIYTVKSKLIDLYLLFGILVYLLFIYVYIKGIKGTISDIKNAFSE